MSNIADLIEGYILRRLAEQEEGNIELRRGEIAGAISCAPSQISYVLNTRFTPDKGFSVESRRGLGGYIRIKRISMKELIYEDLISKVDEFTDFEEYRDIIMYLIKNEMITRREGAVIIQVARSAFLGMEPSIRVNMLRSILMTLAQF